MKNTARLSAPTNVCLCVTSECNLNCRHCFARSTSSREDLSSAGISGIIRDLAARKVFFVSLFGGEPFIRGDIINIIALLSTFPIGISINTNATLIDDHLAKALADYKVSFVVSLDGSSAEIVDRIRGRGVFEKTLGGIRALRKYNHDILISTTVMSHNYDNLFEIAALGKEAGAVGVRFNNVFYINNAECYLKDIFLTPGQNLELYDTCEELKARYGGFVSGSSLQTMDLIRAVRRNEIPCDGAPIQVPPCGAGIDKCAIKPDGEVTPCEVLWNTTAGNVRDKPFGEIWADSPVLNEFRASLCLSDLEIGDCISCRYRFICFTGHRCVPYFSAGGIGNRDLYCIKTWMP
ncbi:MAG: radical SAM protein [Syntrophobacter sp.]